MLVRSPRSRRKGASLIISHQHRFIFVKTAKTAGTSIETYLSPHCGERDVLTPFTGGDEVGHRPRNYEGAYNPIADLWAARRLGVDLSAKGAVVTALKTRERYFHHMPAWQIRVRARRPWRDYLSFCVIRDPVDAVVSGYFYNLWRHQRHIEFDAYVDGLERRKARRFHGVGSWPVNLYNYSDPATGEVLVDRLLRFEDLEADFKSVLDELGIPWSGTLPRRKSGMRGDLDLSPEQRSRVERLCREELELHRSLTERGQLGGG